MVFNSSTIVNMVAGDFFISEAFAAVALLTSFANFGRSMTNKFYRTKKSMGKIRLVLHHLDIYFPLFFMEKNK